MLQVFLIYANVSRLFLSAILSDLCAILQAERLAFRLYDALKIRSTGSFSFLAIFSIFKILQICDCILSMNSRVQNLLVILTLVSMESSHLVIFSTSDKFITKFNVLRCISLSETLFWTGARGSLKPQWLNHKTLCDKHSSTKMPQSKALYMYKRKRFLLILHYKILRFTNEQLESMKNEQKKEVS